MNGWRLIHNRDSGNILLRRTARVLCGAALAFCSLAGTLTADESRAAPAAELKAAFVYSFIRYSEWPDKPEQVHIALFGSHELYARLARMIARRPNQARPRYRLCDREACIASAHVLYIGKDDPLAARLPELAPHGALTISDMPGFLEAGGIIELRKRNHRFSFRVSLANARKQGVHLNPEMLQYADEVIR